MKNILVKITILAVLAVGLSACYPGGAEYVSDVDVVVTNYNPDYNFKSIKTYFLADSIRHLVAEGEEPDRSMDPFIIDELERNFDALGYDRLDTNDINAGEVPDVDIVVTIALITVTNIYYDPWYPGWGWGWGGYPGYGWGYPWYGGGTYVSSYETGTIYWLMFDPDDVDEDGEIINLNWEGVINGLLGTKVANTQSRITTGIDQAFKQSPYLLGE